MPSPTRTFLPLMLVATALVAGCSGDRMGFPGSGPTADPIAAPAAPPMPMAGRWVFQSGGRQCNMNFGQPSPQAPEGTVAPAGGCPGQFFTTRKWTFDSNGLLLSNHNSEPLARLSMAGGNFNGTASAGDPVTLSR